MPQIDSGLIIFNTLLTIGIIFISRNSSEEPLTNKDSKKENYRQNKNKQKISQSKITKEKQERSEKKQKSEENLTEGEYLLKQVRGKINKSKMPKYYREDYLIEKEIQSSL